MVARVGLTGTGHARQLAVQTEVVLEGDGREGLALALHLDALFRLDRLMQTLVEASAVHQTAGELVDDQHLAVLDDVVDVELHDAVRLDRLIDMVLDGKVLGIGEVLEMEIFLRLLDAQLGEGSGFLLFVDNVVDAVLGVIRLHVLLGIQLSEALELECLGKAVRLFIEVGGLVALTGNDQRRSRFIDEDGVDLVDDCKGVAALYLVFLVDDHVVSQVVEAKLVVGAVGDIGVVGFLSERVLEVMDDQTDLETHVFIELAHPLGVTAGKVVVDGDDVFHLSDTSLMEHDAAQHLNGEVLHSEHTPARLTAGGERVGENIVGGLAVRETFLEERRLVFQLALAHSGILAFKRDDLVSDRLDPLDLALAVVAEHCF